MAGGLASPCSAEIETVSGVAHQYAYLIVEKDLINMEEPFEAD